MEEVQETGKQRTRFQRDTKIYFKPDLPALRRINITSAMLERTLKGRKTHWTVLVSVSTFSGRADGLP